MAVAYQSAIAAHQGGASDAGGPGDSLAPLLEGARARGVADAFELCGQPAILMGGAGDVLHVGAAAQALLGEGLRLRAGRLAPRDPAQAASAPVWRPRWPGGVMGIKIPSRWRRPVAAKCACESCPSRAVKAIWPSF